jgi:hypothetical protein
MRRILIWPLFLALLLPIYLPALPLLTTSEKPDLPACCRRDGKHHCAMMMAALEQGTDASPAFRTGPANCPFRSSDVVTGYSLSAIVPVATPIYAKLRAHARTHQFALLDVLFLDQSGHPKRGPPSFHC